MVYLQIEEDEIPVGNFSFVYDHTKNEELFGKFYEAEKNLKVDYLDFAHKIRMAFEAFALDEESKKRKTTSGIFKYGYFVHKGADNI